jgi:hypothetical protein
MSEEDVLNEVKCGLVGRREFLKRVSSAGVGAVIVPSLHVGPAGASAGQGAGDAMESAFKEPPNSAKVRVWWHWMSGNVTKEGITLDLEWMKRVGLGGVQHVEADLGTAQYVDTSLKLMSPGWKDAFRYAAAECDRLGLDMTTNISPGWSESGGPWVKPEEAMKKAVWSETRVEGPRKFTGKLQPPPSVNGIFQTLERPRPVIEPPEMAAGAKPTPTPAPVPYPTHYADSAVIAYRLPEGEVLMADLHPQVTSSGGNIDLATLVGGDLNKTVALPFPEDEKPAWIQFEFTQPFRTRAFSIAIQVGGRSFAGGGMPEGEVRASQDGTNFITLVNLPGPAHSGAPLRTFSFPETTARFYRVVLTPPRRTPRRAPNTIPSRRIPAPPKEFKIAALEFHSGARVHRWEEKAGFGTMFEYDSVPTPAVPSAAAIPRAGVIDLTSRMASDGRLEWDVPEGKWVILRLGYSLTGATIHPAPPDETGYEVDKLSRKHVESFLRGWVDPLAETLGPEFGKTFKYFLMDSWEAGLQNWTDDMLKEFRARRGYDPTPYLPVLTGRVVESAEVSDRFLWDLRRTIADLTAEYHYGVTAEFLHQRGLQVFAEAAGVGFPTIQDALQNKGRVDIPMGEFWTVEKPGVHRPEFHADIREASSAVHIYGKNLVGAESFTAALTDDWGPPSTLKELADYNLALGVNCFCIASSVHQPFAKGHKPGFTLSIYGQHFTRNITYAEQAGPWMAYLARNSYMLRQGMFVGDLAYYYGEGAPVAVPYWEKVKPEPPEGYAYDYLNAEVLLTRMSVENGRLVLPDGMSYRVLVLPDTLNRLTPPVLRKIRDFVVAGATVVGPKPTTSPSLTRYPSADDEIRALANEVWGDCDGRTITEHACGKGKVYWGKSLQEVMEALKTPPDFEYTRPNLDTFLVSIHRHSPDADIYFVANRRDQVEDLEVSFRVEGKAAELWHPDTGEIEPAEYRIANGRTTVPLRLDPWGSVFVVFRHPATSPSRTFPHPVRTALTTVEGGWDVSFPPHWGAPPTIHLEGLTSWTKHSDDGVKYYSGTATYTKEIEARQEWFRPGAKLVLDLGDVRELAEVSVNGKPLGILWKPLFQIDVTSALKPGRNHLEIKITNLWLNRLVGDLQPSAKNMYTFITFQHYTADTPLLDSGLLGPVRLFTVTMR